MEKESQSGMSPEAKGNKENKGNTLGRRPTQGSVHVWLCVRSYLSLPTELLTPGDLVSLARTTQQEARASRVAARLLLRSLLARFYSEAIARAEFGEGPHGKPFLLTPAGTLPAGFDFSLSHSRDFVAVALSEAGEVGVDVEAGACSKERALRLASRVFDPVTLAQVSTLEENDPDAIAPFFLTQWSAREALLKRTGEGLTRDPRSLLVPASLALNEVSRVGDAEVTLLCHHPSTAVAVSFGAIVSFFPDTIVP